MRRIRISTWVLAAIFVAALALYVLLKPSSASNTCQPQPDQQAKQTTAPGVPGVASGSPQPSPSGSEFCG